MGARQWLNDHQRISGSLGSAVTLIALFFMLARFHRHQSNGRLEPDQAFFSDDDGTTYFRDSAARLPPFDHHGKTAFGAVVLRCVGGKPFVAFLRKYDPTELEQLEERLRQSPTPGLLLSELGARAEVKRPHESRWVSYKSDPKEYARVTTPQCPGGGDAFTSVMPDDPDSGATN